MAKASAAKIAANNRYTARAYDRVALVIPKGCKATVEARAAETGESVNGLINRLLRVECGLSLEEWTGKSEDC